MGMLRLIPEVDFLFIFYLVIMPWIDSRGCNKFRAKTRIMGKKSGSNIEFAGIGL